jgi:Copper amine oxidase N-terminal domain
MTTRRKPLTVCMLTALLSVSPLLNQVTAAEKTSVVQNGKQTSYNGASSTIKSVYSVPSQSYALFVNGEEKRGPGFYTYMDQVFFQDGTIYVPIEAIVPDMGGRVEWNDALTSTVIKTKDLVVWEFKWNGIPGKAPIYIGRERSNINTAPVKGIFKDSLFVPLDFVARYYPVKIIKDKSGIAMIFVGTVPSNPTVNFFGTKGQYPSTFNFNPLDPNAVYPGGWKAPQLKSTWSPNEEKNFQAFKNELGFEGEGHWFSIPGQTYAIVLYSHKSGIGNNEIMMKFRMWGDPPGKPNPLISYSYKIPIVSAQLFKFYFEKDWLTVWNYFNRNDIPEQFTANGRTVKSSFNEREGALYLEIGYKKTR